MRDVRMSRAAFRAELACSLDEVEEAGVDFKLHVDSRNVVLHTAHARLDVCRANRGMRLKLNRTGAQWRRAVIV